MASMSKVNSRVCSKICQGPRRRGAQFCLQQEGLSFPASQELLPQPDATQSVQPVPQTQKVNGPHAI